MFLGQRQLELVCLGCMHNAVCRVYIFDAAMVV